MRPAPTFRLIEVVYQSHPNWLERNWIPVAEDGFGNYYVLDSTENVLKTHPIYFIDHEEGDDKPYFIAASELWVFIRFLLEGERTKDRRFPFDKNYVLEKDPNLKTYAGNIPLPWEA